MTPVLLPEVAKLLDSMPTEKYNCIKNDVVLYRVSSNEQIK